MHQTSPQYTDIYARQQMDPLQYERSMEIIKCEVPEIKRFLELRIFSIRYCHICWRSSGVIC